MVHLERIKELCKKKNVTMKRATIELDMTEQSLHKILKANSTKIDTLLTMVQFFNIEPAYFFDNYSVNDTKKEYSPNYHKVGDDGASTVMPKFRNYLYGIP